MTTHHNRTLNLASDIIQTLYTVFWDNLYATKAIQKTIKKHNKWDDHTKAYFAETIYDIIRHWRLLWHLQNQEPTPNKQDLQRLITLYQNYAQKTLTPIQQKRLKQAQHIRSLRESLPAWLDKQGQQELNERWENIITALNQKPDQTIRVNTLKTSQKTLIEILKKQGVTAKPHPWSPDALIMKEKINLFKLPSFQEGLFEIQDAASQMASHLLNPQPGQRIVDACAGEGSKTLHLAALMHNKGKIIALDTQAWRLKELRRRANKAGANTIETRHLVSTKIYKRIQDTADKLLLDVPCTGLGTLRRNPDIKWKLTPDDLTRLTTLQQQLLEQYSTLLKNDGHMAYAVCSILPSEGEQQIQTFLTKHPTQYQLIKEQRYWPDTDHTDGFYIALLQRKK